MTNQPADSYESRLRAVLGVVQRYLPPDGIGAKEALSEITALVDPWPVLASSPIEAATLHQQIMNIRPAEGVLAGMGEAFRDGYAVGHRDARHAAAEFVLASAPIEAAQTGADLTALLSEARHYISQATERNVPGWVAFCKRIDAALASAPPAAATVPPLDMLLYCPNCGMQHVDAPDRLEPIIHAQSGTVVDELWTNPPHRSHKCHGCGCIWRPADVPTNGVAAIKTEGKADTWPAVHNEEVRAAPAAATVEVPDEAAAPKQSHQPTEQCRQPVTQSHQAAAAAAAGVPTLTERKRFAPVLRNVIECLRSTSRFTDEEGETTNELEDLLVIIEAGIASPVAPAGAPTKGEQQ